MGAFFIYILKSAVCLVLFYLFFKLLLSKETFHRFNRVALLGVLLLSLLIPCIEITTRHQIEVQQAVLSIEQLLMMEEMKNATFTEPAELEQAPVVSWIQIVLLIYLTGILILIIRNTYSLLSLLKLIYTGKREKLEKGLMLVVHDREIAPFSWMTHIVISRKDLEENGREILIHETAHIRNHHSIDLLIADICILFQWFNPGAWLLKQELQNIHEYEADETVINEGVNAKEYQLLLIKKAVGTRLYSMANSFNHSKLKKRITMMLKEKSNPWSRLKYLYILPLAAVAITAFARPEISEKAEEISTVKVNDLAKFMQENVLQDTVKASKGVANVLQSKKKAILVEATDKTNDDEEIVVFEVVEQMPEYPGGLEALSKYLSEKIARSNLGDRAEGNVTVGFIVSETGKVKDVKAFQADQLELIKEAERIVSEMPDWIPGKQRGMPVPVRYSVPVRFGNIKFATNEKPLVMIDGKEKSVDALEKLSKESMESVTILKDSASIAKYGKRGAYGVILVNTKKANDMNSTKVMEASVEDHVGVKNAVPDFPVTGTVVDEQGRPKAGVSIIIPNTVIGTITDANGHFHMNAIKGGKLWFSFVGYKTVKASVTSQMSIQMEQEVVKLLSEESNALKPAQSDTNLDEDGGLILQKNKDGERSLIIIDGKEALGDDPVSQIPNDRVKSFTILKGKTALDAYGDKGKNGVFIINLLTEEEYQLEQSKPE